MEETGYGGYDVAFCGGRAHPDAGFDGHDVAGDAGFVLVVAEVVAVVGECLGGFSGFVWGGQWKGGGGGELGWGWGVGRAPS